MGFLAGFFAVVFAMSAAADVSTPVGEVPPREAEAPPELWFPVGEDLLYRVYWGIIPIGKARVVTQWVREDGRWLLAIRARTRSNRVVAALYPFDDIIETIVDLEEFRPVVFTKNLREGRHRYHEITNFDYAAGVARWMSFTKQKTREYAITPELRDVLSFMYFLRSMEFPAALHDTYTIVVDEDIYQLSMRIGEPRKRKIAHFGKVPCVEVTPLAELRGLFVHEGRVRIWISLRDRPLITCIKARTDLGGVRAVLTEVNGPGDDFWTRQTRKHLHLAPRAEADPAVEDAMRELDASPDP